MRFLCNGIHDLVMQKILQDKSVYSLGIYESYAT